MPVDPRPTSTAPASTLGIDEAGRGPVLGPLVVAAVVLRPRQSAALTRRGVCDSKLLGSTPEARLRRAELAWHVRRTADRVTITIHDHAEVDCYTREGRLNELERLAARRLIALSPPVRRIVADGVQVFGPLRAEFPHLRAFDDGESVHVAVAAASIVAKDCRDRLFSAIASRYREEFGEVRGGGYVNAATADFLRRHHQRYGCLPAETRRSWEWSVLLELVGPGTPVVREDAIEVSPRPEGSESPTSRLTRTDEASAGPPSPPEGGQAT